MYGAPYVMLHRADLHALLVAAARPEHIELGNEIVDPDWQMRNWAVLAASGMGNDAAALLPGMLLLRNDPDRRVRDALSYSLYKIDPKQFAKPPIPE